jgi:hypothetical protein
MDKSTASAEIAFSVHSLAAGSACWRDAVEFKVPGQIGLSFLVATGTTQDLDDAVMIGSGPTTSGVYTN